MQKLFSSIVGMPVFEEHNTSPISLVQDLIIDPENGKVLAFLVGGNQIIVPMDVERLGRGLFITDRDRILHLNEVLRVNEVFMRHISIIGSKVVTEATKAELGKAVDYEIDTTLMSLTKIHTAKIFLFFHFDERIISYRHIVKINKNLIVVKDAHTKVLEEEAKVQSTAFAA